MVKRGFTIFVFWHVFAGNNRDVHYAAATGFSHIRGLLCAMPDTSVMNSQIAGVDIKPDFAGVGIIIYKVFFLEK